jgi:hypothetical protein
MLLLSPTPGTLTIRFTARTLAGSHSRIGTEPSAANTAGFLSSVWHGDSSSPPIKGSLAGSVQSGWTTFGEQAWVTFGKRRRFPSAFLKRRQEKVNFPLSFEKGEGKKQISRRLFRKRTGKTFFPPAFSKRRRENVNFLRAF